jgi:hypothetical protein
MIRYVMLAAVAALLACPGVAAAAKPVLPPPVQVTPAPADAVVRPAVLVRTVVTIPEGQEWAAWGPNLTCALFAMNKLNWREADIERKLDRFPPVVEEEFAAAGFGKAPSHDLFSNVDGGGDGDSLQLGLRIDGMDGRFCVTDPDSGPEMLSGSILMTAEWQVYDPLKREVVARIPTVAGGKGRGSYDGGLFIVMLAAVRESTRALLADETFRKLVLSSPTESPTAVKADAGPITLAGAAGAGPRPIGEVSGSVVALFTGSAMGSGFLVSSDGYILTNQHVVGAATKVRVRWSDGLETTGEVVRADKRRDVALVKTDSRDRPPLALARGTPAVGAGVYAVGTPLDAALQNTVTRGIVSANRFIDGFAYIQSDVSIDHGNSGGPLLDEKGRAIGITAIKIAPDDGQRNLNLFIPIGDALDFLQLKTGR